MENRPAEAPSPVLALSSKSTLDFRLTRWNKFDYRIELLPLEEARINGRPCTLEGLERFAGALENALSIPMFRDKTDYTPFFRDLTDERVNVKMAFNLVLTANYIALSGRSRSEDEQALLVELFFADFGDQPFILVDQAFKLWRKNQNWFPTPCDIARHINGWEGDWDARGGTAKGATVSIKEQYHRSLLHMRRIIERERQKAQVTPEPPQVALPHLTTPEFNIFSTESAKENEPIRR